MHFKFITCTCGLSSSIRTSKWEMKNEIMPTNCLEILTCFELEVMMVARETGSVIMPFQKIYKGRD